MTAELILNPKQLSLDDLPLLVRVSRIENDIVTFDRSLKGYKLKTSVSIPIEKILTIGQKGLIEYIINSLISQRPRLIPTVIENKSLIELAKYFLRARSGSLIGFYAYINTINLYCRFLNSNPDQIISDVKTDEGQGNDSKVEKHRGFLDTCLAELQDRGLSAGRIHSYAKHVRTFYRVNGIDIRACYLPRAGITRKDRAPKPEELQRLMDLGDTREKAILSMMALGGFREGTLIRLLYSHVRADLENGVSPLHVHVESDITKGKYHDYDTFLGAEAAESLRSYLNARRKGLIDRRIPREDINDESPLIRDHLVKRVKPIGEKQLYTIIHRLYSRAGLLKKGKNGGYDLRPHSLRKYFKTQLAALGVQSDYVEYMMGHTISTYHDIQSNGVEFLRSVYTTAGLSISPKSKGWELQALKAFARGLGLEPEKVLTQAAFAEPHRAYMTAEDEEKTQTQTLSLAIKELIKKELLTSQNSSNPTNSVIQAQ